MEKINVAELLKECPKGMELDCTMYDDTHFHEITEDPIFPICIKRNDGFPITLTKYGEYANCPSSKCVIFPKGKTTWEGFHRPWTIQDAKDGDVISYGDGWICIFKCIHGIWYSSYCFITCDGEFHTAYERHSVDSTINSKAHLATNEQSKLLFQKIKEAGYKWNAETKSLDKLIEPKFKVGDTISNGKASITINYIDNEYYCEIGRDFATKLPIKNQDEWDLISEKFPNKFNINTLIPFESRVLVRNDEHQYWIPAFWGCKRADGYTTTFGWCKYCIPFEGNEHLLETTNDCNEYFKTWK